MELPSPLTLTGKGKMQEWGDFLYKKNEMSPLFWGRKLKVASYGGFRTQYNCA